MKTIRYEWQAGRVRHDFALAYVQGSGGQPFRFGETGQERAIEVPGFYIATTPVTQAFWSHVMGADSNPACGRGDRRPVENVSWNDITGPDGFFERINESGLLPQIARQIGRSTGLAFRLPSESEWEYAARGGPHCRDALRYSGSDDIDAVAWFKDNSGDHTHEVELKAPNQLGLHDMSGNVWEWCQDRFTPDVRSIPADGRPFLGPGEEHVLRGGCFHNWAIHCTVSKRYAIAPGAHDGCIGFRIVLAAARDDAGPRATGGGADAHPADGRG